MKDYRDIMYQDLLKYRIQLYEKELVNFYHLLYLSINQETSRYLYVSASIIKALTLDLKVTIPEEVKKYL